ncbi:BQ5605_C013g07140 [Microbotryum silenes-dioicae]|uniref:BQ5605_C013g07140 protein n=1 Tax=Microbotryum silenes-dioicae TaxID=796604 RepID=A0A2X0LUD4_9BASI|nr:BQ5605_C013g07140 [Microbotryum silenes-dioicae]
MPNGLIIHHIGHDVLIQPTQFTILPETGQAVDPSTLLPCASGGLKFLSSGTGSVGLAKGAEEDLACYSGHLGTRRRDWVSILDGFGRVDKVPLTLRFGEDIESR